MTTSPLSRIFAPISAPVVETLAPVAPVVALVQPKAKAETLPPAIGQLMQKLMDEQASRRWDAHRKDKTVNPFAPASEAVIRAEAAEITDAVRKAFPDYEVTETVEGPEYRPPFSTSWQITKKGGR